MLQRHRPNPFLGQHLTVPPNTAVTRLKPAPQKRRGKQEAKRVPPPKRVRIQATPEMRQFVVNYYRRWATPLGARTALQWYLDRYKLKVFENRTKEANVTLFTGGSFLVPNDLLHGYFEAMAKDISEDRFNPHQEIAKNQAMVTLMLELDWRYPRLRDTPPDHDAIIALAHKTALAYYPKTEVHTLVFTREPCPKYTMGRWMIATGVHMIFTVLVNIADGAQISHAVREALLAVDADSAEGVDNIYAKYGTYTKNPCLRPPCAAKQVVCAICSDPDFKVPDKSKQNDFSQCNLEEISCGNCAGQQKVLDKNVYRLAYVLRPDGTRDASAKDRYDADLVEMLAVTSILSQRNPWIPISQPAGHAIFSLREISKPAVPVVHTVHATSGTADLHRANEQEIRSTEKGTKLKITDILRTMCRVAPKFLRRRRSATLFHVVPISNALRRLLIPALARVSQEYQAASVHKGCIYGLVALVLTLKGDGSTHCMVKGQSHNSNRARLVFIDDGMPRAFAGCFSDHCRGQMVSVPCDTMRVRDILQHCRRQITGRAAIPGTV